jgi:hypothetical protein
MVDNVSAIVDAAAAPLALSSLPMRKRKGGATEDEPESKLTKEGASIDESGRDEAKDDKKEPVLNVRAREIRLEQNRKAARESRRRKKVMIVRQCACLFPLLVLLYCCFGDQVHRPHVRLLRVHIIATI